MNSDLGYTAVDVAKWFINATDRESGDDMTHLKVQKLIYYAQGWSLAYFDTPLFRETLEAWVHGPVAPSVWDQFKEFEWKSLPVQRLTRKIAAPHADLLAAVSGKYGIFSAKKLENMTHNEDPWKAARGDLPDHARCRNAISVEHMKHYFKSLMSG